MQRVYSNHDTGAELAHDARNLLSAMNLYCELLSGPGVLAPGFRHYADDLRVVGETGARLIEALASPSARRAPRGPISLPPRRRPFPGIEDLGAEVLSLAAPLRALAGPSIRVEVECAPCAGALALNSEELLRILFNLVANSVEAMLARPSPGRQALLRVTAQRGGGVSFLHDPRPEDAPRSVLLAVRDNGPGIAAAHLERIFDAGFSTRNQGRDSRREAKPGPPVRGETLHGLGLSIVRQLAAAAGGTVRAFSSRGLGARFEIELPLLDDLAMTPADGRRVASRLSLAGKKTKCLTPNEEGGIEC